MMAMSLKPIQFNRGEFIIKQGEMASEMFFVARGVAEIVNEETGQIYGQFKTGTFFGEIGLLFKVARTASVRCTSEVMNVFKLTKDDLDTILEQFPEVAEKINQEAKARLEKDKQNKVLALSKTEEANADVEVTREKLKTVWNHLITGSNVPRRISWFPASTGSKFEAQKIQKRRSHYKKRRDRSQHVYYFGRNSCRCERRRSNNICRAYKQQLFRRSGSVLRHR